MATQNTPGSEVSIKIGDDWQTTETSIAFSWGRKQDIRLSIRVRYDGNGNSVVRYTVTKDGQETSYEKYDSAAGAYELLNMKG